MQKAMPDRDAEERLGAIRCLMEHAASYRAISARTALVGGLLSTATAAALLAWQAKDDDRNVNALEFFVAWTLILILTLTASAFFLLDATRRRGESAPSAGMKLAVRCMAPAWFAGGAIGAVLTLTTEQALLPTLMWLVFYGLSLLSTMNFAPRSVVLLGWIFLLTGIGFFIYFLNQTLLPEIDLPTPTRFYPAAIMGATFGIYHLVYAMCTWPRRGQGSTAARLASDDHSPFASHP